MMRKNQLYFALLLLFFQASNLNGQSGFTIGLDIPLPNFRTNWIGAPTTEDLVVCAYENAFLSNEMVVIWLDTNGVQQASWQLTGLGNVKTSQIACDDDHIYLIDHVYDVDSAGYSLHKFNFRTGQMILNRTRWFPIRYSGVWDLVVQSLEVDKNGNILLGGTMQDDDPWDPGFPRYGEYLEKLDSNLNSIFEGVSWGDPFVSNLDDMGIYRVFPTNDGGFLTICYDDELSIPVATIEKYTNPPLMDWSFQPERQLVPGFFDLEEPYVIYEVDTAYLFIAPNTWPVNTGQMLSLNKQTGAVNWLRGQMPNFTDYGAREHQYGLQGNDGKLFFSTNEKVLVTLKPSGDIQYVDTLETPDVPSTVDDHYLYLAPAGHSRIAAIYDTILFVRPLGERAHCSLGPDSLADGDTLAIENYFLNFSPPIWNSLFPSTISWGLTGSATPLPVSGMNTCGCGPTIAGFQVAVSADSAVFTNLSQTNGGQIYQWDFGDSITSTDANPVHTYTQSGSYTVCLTVLDSCGNDTYCDTISISIVGIEEGRLANVSLKPNPSNGQFQVTWPKELGEEVAFRIYDLRGKMQILKEAQIQDGPKSFSMDLELMNYATGVYLLEIRSQVGTLWKRVVVQ